MEQSAKVIDITEVPDKEQKASNEIAVFVAHKIAVVDSETMTLADEAVQKADKRLDLIEEEFGAFRDAAHKAHKGWTGLINRLSTPVKEFKDYHVSQVKQYKIKLKQEAEAEERRLTEIARKEEEDRRMKEAEQAEKEGNHEEAEAIIQEEIYVPPPVVKVEMPKVNNTKYRIIPKARIINKMDVIKAVAMNPALQDLIDINQSAANNKAKALGKSLDATIKGLQYYEE